MSSRVDAAFIDNTILDLQELKRMSGNPLLLEAMRRIVAESDGGALPLLNRLDPRNGLTESVLDAAKSFGRPFTVPDIVNALKKSEYRFATRTPYIAVLPPVKSLMKRGLIRRIVHGAGSRPSVYEYIGGGSKSLPTVDVALNGEQK